MADKVSLTTDGGVAVVTLNALEARNALTNETIDELCGRPRPNAAPALSVPWC